MAQADVRTLRARGSGTPLAAPCIDDPTSSPPVALRQAAPPHRGRPEEARLKPARASARRSPAARRARIRAFFQAFLGVVGVVSLAALVRHVGAHALLGILQRAASLIPLVVALEAARLGCDTLATSTLCPPRRIPLSELVRIHVVTYPIAALMPAGKTTAEAVKAAMLSPLLGTPRAAAIAAMNQSLSLIAAGVLSLVAAIAIFRSAGASLLAFGVVAHFVGSVAGGFAIAFATRRRALGAWLARRFARAGNAAAAFHDAMREHPPLPPRTLAALLANRALQATQYAVLLAAVGAATGPSRALIAHGVNAVGTTLGDLIPAQVGATDGAFTFAAPLLGVAASAAVAVAVLAHVVQASVAVAGTIAAAVWRRKRPAPSAAAPAGEASPAQGPAHTR